MLQKEKKKKKICNMIQYSLSFLLCFGLHQLPNKWSGS